VILIVILLLSLSVWTIFTQEKSRRRGIKERCCCDRCRHFLLQKLSICPQEDFSSGKKKGRRK
jgi:hypothetical protein